MASSRSDRNGNRSPVAVITGGASGFGAALGHRCAEKGFAVAALDIDGDRASTAAAELAGAHGTAAIGLRVDVSDAGAVASAAATVAETLGGADLVISNVGVQQIGAFEAYPDEAWSWLLDVNVVGAARVARAFLPLLRLSEQPRLAFTASSSVLEPATHLAAYQASKFAVMGLAETLRRELTPDGISVSVIFPSGMMTRHIESSLAARPGGVPGDIAPAGDVEAMVAGNEAFARDVATAEDASRHVIDEIIAAEHYIVTHGDLVEALAGRNAELERAATRAREWSARTTG